MTTQNPHGERQETDSLGSAALPAEALFGIRTWRCLQNLSFSNKTLAQYPSMIKGMAQVKQAAAIANTRAGILDERRRDAILEACAEVIAGRHQAAFVVDPFAGGGSIAVNSNVNEVIANLACERLGQPRGTYDPVHPKAHVNASQSTADACHSALNLAALAQGATLNEALCRLQAAAAAKGQELRDVVVIARTCLQDAMPARMGDSFTALATMLERRRVGLADAVGCLRTLSLGGTVIGSGAGAPVIYRREVLSALREVTGADVHVAADLFDAAQHMDQLAAVSAQLALLAGALIKMAKDLRLLTSGPTAGFRELVLPAVQEGSSFFPGKINPVIPETLIQCCFLVAGADHAVKASLEHGELNLNVFEGAAGFVVLDALGMLARSLTTFVDRCFAGITANPSRSQDYEHALAQLTRGTRD